MKNRIDQLFEEHKEGVLNIFFTAGYPELESTVEVAQAPERLPVRA